jgi:hypothetical protein
LLVALLFAQRDMVAIAEPQDVHSLRFVVDAKPRAKSSQMGLNGADAEAKFSTRAVIAPSRHIRTQYLELTRRGWERVP